jgi:hypothetical protein
MLPSNDRLALASSPEAGPSAPHPEAATCRRLVVPPYCVHRRPVGDEHPRRSAPRRAAGLAGPELGDADVHPRARSLPPALARRARECHAVYRPQGKLHHHHLPHRHRHHQHPPAEHRLPPRPHWHPVLVRRNGCCTWRFSPTPRDPRNTTVTLTRNDGPLATPCSDTLCCSTLPFCTSCTWQTLEGKSPICRRPCWRTA